MQYLAIFHGCKNDNFQMKKIDIFPIFAQNIDCGYTNAYPSIPQFHYIQVGCKKVYITWTCYHDVLLSCLLYKMHATTNWELLLFIKPSSIAVSPLKFMTN